MRALSMQTVPSPFHTKPAVVAHCTVEEALELLKAGINESFDHLLLVIGLPLDQISSPSHLSGLELFCPCPKSLPTVFITFDSLSKLLLYGRSAAAGYVLLAAAPSSTNICQPVPFE